ncbi:MAG TPA: hybrid sensor histidine kinase/response regulator transcription factor [Solirubrobacteraceae bacterium]|nr:hybrid sensor histidine kinase/response regulator transcription factor [Solirubrobacteraceae bacterium]
MSVGSASPPTERPGVDRAALERLIGARSPEPSFHAAWGDKSARRDNTIETLERISSALCAAPGGPVAVCDAVVEAAAHLFDARWAAMVFAGEHAGVGARVFVHAGDCVIQRWGLPPRMLEALTDRTLAAQHPLLAEHDEGIECGTLSGVLVTAPMSVQGEPAGILAVGLPNGIEVAPGDVSILVTLANHAGVALHEASLFQENKRRAAELERRGSELERRGLELEETVRRLEQAGRRQLLSEERNRIARELHDSVSQHLLTIGMNLEWCRRNESTPPEVVERVLSAQGLARSAMDQIREVIFGLVSEREIELPQALREVIEDVEAGAHLEVGLRVYGEPHPLPASTQHALVQIAREALFNVVRHAEAQRAWITLRWRPQVVSLAVADDGSGDHRKLHHKLFISETNGDHLGLAGIAERVRELGGAAWFERRRGGGVKLRVEVPVRLLPQASHVEPEPDERAAPAARRLADGGPTEDKAAFTEREREVIRLITNGLSNREIGCHIFVSRSTAKFHVRNVMRKLGVHSRAEVAYAAGKRGLLDEPAR